MPLVTTDHTKGLVITTASVVVLSPDSLIVRLISADQWTLLFWRGALAGTGTFVLFALMNGGATVARCRVIGRTGLLAALLFGAGTIFFITALTHTSVAKTLIIASAAPLFAAVQSRLFLNEPVPHRTWLAIWVSLGCVALIASHSLQVGTLFGDLAAVCTAACLAGAITAMRRAQTVDMIPAIALSGVILAIVALPLASPFSTTLADLALLALLGLLLLPASQALLATGPRYLSAPEVSMILLLETVLGPYWVWLWLNEAPSWQAMLGGGLLVATLAAHAGFGLRAQACR